MIQLKNKIAIMKMETAGKYLAVIVSELSDYVSEGVTTLYLDQLIEKKIQKVGLVSRMKGYRGYRYVSCISINEQVVHGVPSGTVFLKYGDLVKIDVCVSWKDYCADMARCFFVGAGTSEMQRMVSVTQESLDAGIKRIQCGNRLSDVSHAIQQVVESAGFGVVRDFAGHGIGKKMHEDPEILNYGTPGRGPVLQEGMAFALEPMVTYGKYDVCIMDDGWTIETVDKSWAAQIEDTVILTSNGPHVITRFSV